MSATFFARHRQILSFALLNAAMGVGVGLAKVVAPLYALSLGVDEATLGLVAGAQSAGVLLFGMPTGFLVDRFGPSKLFVTGSLIGGLLYAALPLVPSAVYLVVSSFVISCCMPLRFVPLATVFYEQLETLGEAKAGWLRGSHMGGATVIGPLLAAALAPFMPYGRMYWVIAGLFVVTMTMARRLFRNYGARTRHATEKQSIAKQLGAIVNDVDLRGACIVDMVAMAIIGFFNFFVVVIAVAELGLGPERASALVSGHGVAYVAVLFGAGGIATRLGQRASYALSAAAITLGLGALGTGSGALAMTVGSLVLGCGVGFLHVVNMLRFARIGSRLGRGKIAGINALTGPGGTITASLVGGFLGGKIGLQAVFLCFIPLVSLLLWQLRTPRLKPVEPGTRAEAQGHAVTAPLRSP